MATILDNLEEVYDYIVNDIHYELNTTNKQYQKNMNKLCKISEKYPNIESVCEDQQVVALDVKEVKKLVEYLECKDNLYRMKSQRLLWYGAKYSYEILKKIGLLKEE